MTPQSRYGWRIWHAIGSCGSLGFDAILALKVDSQIGKSGGQVVVSIPASTGTTAPVIDKQSSFAICEGLIHVKTALYHFTQTYTQETSQFVIAGS